MAKIWNFQSNMNRGELDPLLTGRIDLQSYYNGMESATNMLSIPQGGMKKRPGTQYIGTALGNGRLENFSFNVEQNYLLVFSNLRMEIYKDGVLQTNINGTGNDYLVVPWTLAQILEFDYIQSADTIIITHPDVETRTITRTSDTTWTIATAGFTNIPQFDFNDASSPTPVDERHRLTFANHNEGDRYKISLEGILTEELVFAGDDTSNLVNMVNAIQALPNTGNSGVQGEIFTTGTVFDIIFTGEAADDYEILTVTPVFSQNVAFQVTVVKVPISSSGTHTGGTHATILTDAVANFPAEGVVNGQTVQNFTDGSSGTITGVTTTTVTVAALAGGADNQWELGDVYFILVNLGNGTSRKEDTWSATRGWPTTCTFHEGRLWFGGSRQRPATIWGSRPFDFFNFDQGKGLDDESAEATLDTDQVNAIEAIFSNRSLQIFTSGQEFYVPASPITPESIAVKPQSNMGSSRVRPVTVEGATFFVQRTGKALLQFTFLNDLQANQAKSVSLLATHLINTPIKLAISRGTEETDANYVYIINNNGTMTVFNSLTSEDVTGFTPWETAADSNNASKIKSGAVVDNEINLLVERIINGSTVYLIEKENTDFQTDSTITDTTNDAEITGLNHLEGETVWAKADGAFIGSFIVSGGKITLDRTSSDKEAGLSFIPTLVTMPLNMPLQNGPNASLKKKIVRFSLQIFESNGIIVNDQRIPDKTTGIDQFDAPVPRTGFERMSLLGWSIESQVTITQDTPMPLTILNIGMEVSI
ncbi:MAG: hypothetical protein ACE5D7_01395 [Fidelibacterota bacterium]